MLLSEWDEDGLGFRTDTESREADDLAGDPWVALAVLLPGFTRQLVARGTAEQLTGDRIETAFRLRSSYLQQLAWQNSTGFAQLDPDERHRRWDECAARHAGRALPTR